MCSNFHDTDPYILLQTMLDYSADYVLVSRGPGHVISQLSLASTLWYSDHNSF